MADENRFPGLCDFFSNHQTFKFDLYFAYPVYSPLMAEDFHFSVVFLSEIAPVLGPQSNQFCPETGYDARYIRVIHKSFYRRETLM